MLLKKQRVVVSRMYDIKIAVTQAKLLITSHSSYTAQNDFSFIVHCIHFKKMQLKQS